MSTSLNIRNTMLSLNIYSSKTAPSLLHRYYKSNHFLWNNIPDNSFFYFVHSYCCLSSTDAISETTHGENLISALGKDNIFAVQFHPEKSQNLGLQLYKNFLDWGI